MIVPLLQSYSSLWSVGGACPSLAYCIPRWTLFISAVHIHNYKLLSRFILFLVPFCKHSPFILLLNPRCDPVQFILLCKPCCKPTSFCTISSPSKLWRWVYVILRLRFSLQNPRCKKAHSITVSHFSLLEPRTKIQNTQMCYRILRSKLQINFRLNVPTVIRNTVFIGFRFESTEIWKLSKWTSESDLRSPIRHITVTYEESTTKLYYLLSSVGENDAPRLVS